MPATHRLLKRLICSLTMVVVLAAGVPPAGAEPDLATWVDPLIGTYPPGFVNPGPQLPHGMVALGPDTEGPVNYGGYFFINNTISGFSHTHMSAGVFQGGQVPAMPVTGQVQLGDPLSDAGYPGRAPAYSSPFDHATEVSEPGYYRATLERYAVTAELTATLRAGMHRYDFPAGQQANIVIDISRDLKGYHEAAIAFEDEDSISGWVRTDGPAHTVYFAAELSEPASSTATFSGSTITQGSTTATGNRVGGIASFGSGGGEIKMKVGISFVDVEGARANIDAEMPGWDFDAVRSAARDAWNEALGRIEVSGGNDADRTSFYTALYHAQLFPNLFSDADGRYLGADGVVRSSDTPHYTQFSLWDSYRGQNQLLATIDPDAYSDMVDSLLDFHEQSGRLPRWQLANADPGYMSGDPVIPFIAEGWCRGLVHPGRRQALFDAMRALVERRPDYVERGYLPTEKPANPFEVVEGGPREAGTTLEFGLAEFALALMADDINKAGDRDEMLRRAAFYRNLLDPETRWIRPRHADGTWLEMFAPENGYGFQEGTSWQYSWLVMQDLAGLIEAIGGDGVVQERLDTFFMFPVTATTPVAGPKAQNQITVFGIEYRGNQYAPGNEHDLHAPYIYNYAGAPWKTQAAQRGAVSLYTPTPDGLPGNDDLGALSGWLVWSMLGLYPVTPGSPTYAIASPVFDRAVVHGGAEGFTIEAPGTTFLSKYVQGVTLDGEEWDKTWVSHSDLADGGVLSFEMGPVPNLQWGDGEGAAPPSMSTSSLEAFDCRSTPPH